MKIKVNKGQREIKPDETPSNHVMSVGVHQRALYNRLSLCRQTDVQDSQSEIFLSGHASRVTMHAKMC